MDLLLAILNKPIGSTPMEVLEATALAFLFAFVLGQGVAWAYTITHSGLSYSRTFTQSLVLLAMVVAMVMRIIGDNLVVAFGLLGALAIVRFRNVLKDTRDTIFVFLSIVIGMGVGTGKYLTTMLGAVAIVLVLFYLHFTGFGTLDRYDGHVSFLLSGGKGEGDFSQVMQRFCRSFKCISLRRSQDAANYLFQVRLRDPGRSAEFLEALRQISGTSDVALVEREELTET
ncbi:MAG: DUF4956 domain-containing protein [Magnetococcales bacterium]|nr:DUF4956 domain-containing protein [Magnetococcales bacterium]